MSDKKSHINVIFIADPNSIHDAKWIEWICKDHSVRGYVLVRKKHYLQFRESESKKYVAEIIGAIDDFSIVRFYRTLNAAFRIRSMIKRYNISIIHLLYAEPNALWCNFTKYFKVETVISCRGTDVLRTIPEAFNKKSLINYLVAPLYKRAFLISDWVTGTSQAQLNSIHDFSNRRDSLSIVRTGVDISLIKSFTGHKLPIEITKPYILLPRYIQPNYNHEFCIEALNLLPTKLKAMYQVILVGKDDGNLDYQKILEDKMKQVDGVNFIFLKKQSQSNIIELYKQSSLVLMTPKSDGSPVSAMEAMAIGVQVVLGPLNYDPDIFSENVMILKKWDPIELAEVIKNSLENPQNESKLSQSTINLIDIKYNMNKIRDIYFSLCK